MEQHAEIIYEGVKESREYEKTLNKVINECFKNEGLDGLKLYVSITLTDNVRVRELNNIYRNIDRETDVLSFPMFEKEEIEALKKEKSYYENISESKQTQTNNNENKDRETQTNNEGEDKEIQIDNCESEVLGDIVISIPKVEEQAKEYGHSFERELAYMCTHSFFHLMGYDHIEEDDRIKMRAKEDEILNKLKITRE